MTGDVGFIGGGNMASAIIAGLQAQDFSGQLAVCDLSATIRNTHAARGVRVSESPAAIFERCQTVFLATKPQVITTVLAQCQPYVTADHIIVSILAGTTTATLDAGLGRGRIIRTMPNTPLAIGSGMVAIAKGPRATDADQTWVAQLFAHSGKVLLVDEEQLDAVTAVSGSGPAYLFYFAECLVDGAQQLGFDRAAAQLLVGQTLKGSIDYLLAQDDFPASELRQKVTSPGGTTAAALEVFNQADFAGLVERALLAAQIRGKELADA